MNPDLLIVVYCVLVVAASLFGGWLPSLTRLTHTRMQLMISFVAGLMLGVSLFHMLPHAASHIGSLDRAVVWMTIGLLVMFFMIRAFRFHQHEATGAPAAAEPHPRGAAHRLSWVGVAVGLSLHTAIDGVALAASVVARTEGTLFGLGTFVVVWLHKPLDALSITSLMTAGGWSRRLCQYVNAGFAMMCPLGAALFYVGVGGEPGVVVGSALGFTAGVFLCISLGDLLPELQFHAHDRIKLSVALLAGVLLAWSMTLLEARGGGHTLAAVPDGVEARR
ncbi:MAG: ZIP family metal transporter [Planctomycetota bacterium]